MINYPTQLHLVVHFRMLYHNARKHEYEVGPESSVCLRLLKIVLIETAL
jgi:hypothetical protein